MQTKTVHNNLQTHRDGIVYGVVKVVAIRGQLALVEPDNQSACGGCAMSKGCGTKMISGFFSRNMKPLEVLNDFDGDVGDRIEVGMSNAAILKLSALIYLLPLMGMILAALVAASLQMGDFYSLLYAMAGLAVGFFITKSLYSSHKLSTSISLIFQKKINSTTTRNDVASNCSGGVK